MGKKHKASVLAQGGGILLVRRLWGIDQRALLRHFRTLDDEGRRWRFGGAVSDEFLETHAKTVFHAGVVAYGIYDREVLCAVSELRRVAGDQGEIAFSVLPDYRHHGLSTELMKRMLTAASNRAISNLVLLCASDNVAMQQLAHKFGASVDHRGGEVWGIILPPKASLSSAFEEVFHDISGIAQAMALLPLQFFPLQGTQASSVARRRQAAW